MGRVAIRVLEKKLYFIFFFSQLTQPRLPYAVALTGIGTACSSGLGYLSLQENGVLPEYIIRASLLQKYIIYYYRKIYI